MGPQPRNSEKRNRARVGEGHEKKIEQMLSAIQVLGKELRISHVQVKCNLVTAELAFSYFIFLSFQVCHMMVYTEFVEMSLQFRSSE